MKLIIAGSRKLFVDPILIDRLILSANLEPEEIVSGTAKGIDECGELYVSHYNNRENGVRYSRPESINLKQFPADWDTHGKAAGHIRNKQMAEYADALLLIWDGESKGSANMKETMLKLNKPVFEVILRNYNV